MLEEIRDYLAFMIMGMLVIWIPIFAFYTIREMRSFREDRRRMRQQNEEIHAAMMDRINKRIEDEGKGYE